jgi:hypothetical protein
VPVFGLALWVVVLTFCVAFRGLIEVASVLAVLYRRPARGGIEAR